MPGKQPDMLLGHRLEINGPFNNRFSMDENWPP